MKLPSWRFPKDLSPEERRCLLTLLRLMRSRVRQMPLQDLLTHQNLVPFLAYPERYKHPLFLIRRGLRFHAKGWYTNPWLIEWVQERTPVDADDIVEVRDVFTKFINKGVRCIRRSGSK